MRNFEALLGIPDRHRLILVRSRSRGGPIGGVSWEHEEFDALGRLVARYESFDEVLPEGTRQSGWRKFDAEGRLLAEGPLAPAGHAPHRGNPPSPAGDPPSIPLRTTT